PAAFRHPAMRGCLNKFKRVLAFLLAVCGLEFGCSFGVIPGVAAQIQIGTVRVVVRDTNGSSVEAATVTVRNRLTGYTRSSSTDDQGVATFDNVPFDDYVIEAEAVRFEKTNRRITVRSNLRVDVSIALNVPG